MRIDADCGDPELLAAEVRRPRAVVDSGEPCPYIVGTTTKFCVLSSPSLTQEERDAISLMAEVASDPRGVAVHSGCEVAATLRGLLERLSGSGTLSAPG